MSDYHRQPPNGGASRPITLACPDGVTPEMLSAWRDGVLPSDKSAWLDRHTRECAACAERMRDYAAGASALTTQVIPRPGTDLWPGVRAAIERESHGHERRMPRGLALGGMGAGVAALLLVALFAGLFFSHKFGHITSAATPSATTIPAPTGTATTAPTAVPSGPGVWTTMTGCPANAPATVRTVYNASIQQQKAAPTLVTFQRSDDCGQTWTRLTPPQYAGVNYTSNVDVMTLYSDPLNPQIAYLTLQTSGATCASSTACQLQFVTVDSGVHWNRLSLPVPGILGVLSAGRTVDVEGALRPQETRLYGVVTNAGIGASGVTPPGRLVVSSDGVHWSVADAALAAQGYGIWDLAVTPTGSTIYATAEPFNDRQAPNYIPTLSLWSSSDGGQTWTENAHGPDGSYGQGGSVLGMAVGMNGAQPILYVSMTNSNKAQLLASVDGGRNWTVDTQLSTDGGYQLIGVLPDGSAVIAESSQGSGSPTLAWKPGSAQVTVAANTGLQTLGDPVFQQTASGELLWLTGVTDTNGDVATRYVQLKL